MSKTTNNHIQQMNTARDHIISIYTTFGKGFILDIIDQLDLSDDNDVIENFK